MVPQPWAPDAPVVVGDLLSATDCLRAAEAARAEAIVHLGGITHPSEVPYVQGRPLEARSPMHETFPVNVMGTYWVMEAARQVGARVVAFASTMSTLGISPRLGSLPIPVHTMPVDETHPFWAENTYSLSKVIDEEILRAFGRAYGIRAVALRMMAVVFAQGERAVMPSTQASAQASAPGARPQQQGTAGRLGQPAQAAEAGNFVVWEYVDSRDARRPTAWRSRRPTSTCSSRSSSPPTARRSKSTATWRRVSTRTCAGRRSRWGRTT